MVSLLMRTIPFNLWNEFSGVHIFTGRQHTIVGGGGNNSLNVAPNPVLNDKEITVPVITRVGSKKVVKMTTLL